MEVSSARLAAPPTQLPDDLRDKVKQAILEANAALASDNDPQVMASFKEPPSLMALTGMTALLVLIAYIIATISNYQEIRRNWSHYRCQPNVAPFAKFYGHDLTETMNFCVGQSVKEHAPGVIAPIYSGISKVSGVVDGIMTKVDAVEGGISGLLKGFESFVINFLNSFRLFGVRIRMSLVLMREIFERVYGIFIAFIYAAISAITFGENLVCNPLVTFIGTIAGVDICCFSPDTLVAMEDGSYKPIEEVRIHNRLANGAVVTSTYRFDGRATTMVDLRGVIVSGNHYLHTDDGRYVRADLCPGAIPAKSLPYIYCLGTSTNHIPIVSSSGQRLIFTDYEESSDSAVIAAAQSAVEKSLNDGIAGPTVEDYSLGFGMGTQVRTAYGSWRSIALINVGDRLASGAYVTGVVCEECADVCVTPGGITMAAAQLIYDADTRLWRRAAHIYQKTINTPPQTAIHLFVSNGGTFEVANRNGTEMLVVRDYTEGPAAQAPYDAYLETTISRG